MEAVRPYLDSGDLKLIPDKPQFAYSVHAVYSAKADERLMDNVLTGLRSVSKP